MDSGDATTACLHPESELRARVIAGGAVVYVPQCLTCGYAGQAVAKAKVPELPPPFDATLAERYAAAMGAARVQWARKVEDSFHEWYAVYLKSPSWAARLAQVLKRDNYLCQGCLKATARQVHHLYYGNVGDELLLQLVSLCDDCHERVHDEERLKWLLTTLRKKLTVP